jgi:hypothetical protein
MEVFAQLRVAADLTHVTAPSEIASFGLIATPALVINRQVVVSGHVPSLILKPHPAAAARPRVREVDGTPPKDPQDPPDLSVPAF